MIWLDVLLGLGPVIDFVSLNRVYFIADVIRIYLVLDFVVYLCGMI